MAEIFHGMTFADYQAIPALNGSLAKEALKSPTKAAYYRDSPKPRSEALLFGTAWHAAMLEPETLVDLICAVDKLGTGSRSKAFVDWVAANPSKVCFDADDWATLKGMKARAKKDGFELGTGWKSEVVVTWERNGIPHKMRADGLHLDGDAPLILEAKTARECDADNFSKSIANFGYHVSAAHYLDGVQALTCKTPQLFFFVQEKTAPYDWAWYEADKEMLRQGERELNIARQMWLKTEGFTKPELAEIVKPATIGLPKWYRRDIELY